MQRVSLVVPNLEELANVYYRAKEENYPVKSALQADDEKGLLKTQKEMKSKFSLLLVKNVPPQNQLN